MSWGLVLSGGIAQGIASGGVLEVLEREGIKPNAIAGSSMGAIIAALWALGHSASTLRTLCDRLSLLTVAVPNFESGSVSQGFLRQSLDTHLKDLVGDATIGDCKIPFVCVAGRMKEIVTLQDFLRRDAAAVINSKVELHVFPPETRVMDAIMASSAIPFVFSPVVIGNDHFVDLLNFGAIPSRTLKAIHHPDVIIATDTTQSSESYKHFLPPGWREFLEASDKSLEESKKACDLVIRPEMPYGPYRFDKATAFFEAGREAAEQALPLIQNLLIQKT
jgi:NTE family protein